MERTFMPHFADAAELGMLFGPIFIGDSAFSFCISSNEKEERSPFYERDRYLIRKMLYCHYNEQHSSIYPFLSREIQLDHLLREGNIGTGNKILKEARKICIFGKIYRKILCALLSLKTCKTVFFYACDTYVHIVVDI